MSFGAGRLGAGMGRLGALGGSKIPGWVLKAGGVLPSVDLDLANNRAWVNGVGVVSLPSLLSISRAANESYTNNAGVISSIGSNALAVGNAGLQAWEARTNLILQSGSIGTTPWALSNAGTSNPVLTANAAAAPDGTLTATQVAYPAVSVASNFSVVSQSYTGTAASYANSIYLRGNVGGETLYIIGTPNGVSYIRQAVTLTTSWQRFSVSGALTAATWFFEIGTDLRDGSQLATSAQTIFAWGAQGELGAFASPYIPTTTGTVTRAADAITASGALLTAMLKPQVWVYIKSKSIQSSASLFQGNAGGSNFRMASITTPAVRISGASNIDSALGSGTWAGAVASVGYTDATSSFSVANGGTPATGPAQNIGGLSPIAMFSSQAGNAFVDGNILRLTIGSSVLSPAAGKQLSLQ